MKRATLIVGIAMLLVVSTGTALAADPTGTGIAINPNGPRQPSELGYTAKFAADKEAQFQGNIQAQSAGAAAVSSFPVSGTLGGWTTYHEKTNYNCLPALGQSILHWDFGGYVTPTVAAKQGDYTQAVGTITRGMNTTKSGTDDYTALAYINGQYSANGSSWRYVATNDSTSSAFTNRIWNQIGNVGHPLYVRVDLTSLHYAWHQTTIAQHATAAIAYTSSATLTTIADPFTHVSSGTCVATPYTATPDTSCNWVNYATSEYYLAKDVVRSGELPEWF